jgi:hypothetical protein
MESLVSVNGQLGLDSHRRDGARRPSGGSGHSRQALCRRWRPWQGQCPLDCAESRESPLMRHRTLGRRRFSSVPSRHSKSNATGGPSYGGDKWITYQLKPSAPWSAPRLPHLLCARPVVFVSLLHKAQSCIFCLCLLNRCGYGWFNSFLWLGYRHEFPPCYPS